MSNLASVVATIRLMASPGQQAAASRDAASRTLMKAAVDREYGPPEVIRIEDVEKPVPTDDWRLRKPDPPPLGWFMNGLQRPKKINILGMEFAGTVDAIGTNVTRVRVGDRVFGGSFKFGAHAEYACFPERSIARMPNNAGFEDAAAIPYGGISALHFLKTAGVKPGQRVLIYGASSSVGTAAVPSRRNQTSAANSRAMARHLSNWSRP